MKSKNDYLKEYAKRFEDPSDFNELSKEEKNELYQRYVDNAKIAKHQFIAKKYLESEGLRQKFESKTLAERIAEKDAKLTKIGEAPIKGGAEKAKVEPKVEQKAPEVKQEAPKVEKIDVNLDEEEIEFKPEEKVEEKALSEEELELDDGRVSIDLDDEDVEMINDILNFSNQPNLNKDPLKK